MAIYGHRHLGFFFRPVVEVNDRGLRYKGREYGWNAIRKVEVHDSLLDPARGIAGVAGYPWARIYFDDGERLRLNARALERQGKKPEVDFVSGKSRAFLEVIVALKVHGARLTPSARELAVYNIKMAAILLLGVLAIFAILAYLDAQL